MAFIPKVIAMILAIPLILLKGLLGGFIGVFS